MSRQSQTVIPQNYASVSLTRTIIDNTALEWSAISPLGCISPGTKFIFRQSQINQYYTKNGVSKKVWGSHRGLMPTYFTELNTGYLKSSASVEISIYFAFNYRIPILQVRIFQSSMWCDKEFGDGSQGTDPVHF